MMRPMDMNWCADNTGRNAMIKVLSLLTRKDGISHEQFVRHWYDIHGPLALAVPGIRRYVQSHITESLTRPDIPETDVAVDGIAELWYDDLESFRRAAATPEMKTLTDDGALFIGRIKTYVIEERDIIPGKK
jgi:uncharacterized protein (TIGR02118 family)